MVFNFLFRLERQEEEKKTSTTHARTKTLTTMASVKSALRPIGCCANAIKELRQQVPRRQFLHTVHSPRKEKIAFPTTIPEQFISQIPKFCRPGKGMI